MAFNFVNPPNQPFVNGTRTHDYQHGRRLFLGKVDTGQQQDLVPVANVTNLMPKQSFLYYVAINPVMQTDDFLSGALSIFTNGMGALGPSGQVNAMVKSVDLPRFTVDAKTMNAYNKKTIVQNKVNYDPVTLTFYDDAANLVLGFWNKYFMHYYRDSDYLVDGASNGVYSIPTTYDLRQKTKWGFTPTKAKLKPFLRDIQIFALNQKTFTEYRLINPVITTWRNGQLSSADGAGTLECSMTVAYEAVKFRAGQVGPVDMLGWADLSYYDNAPSPLAGNNLNLYSNQGIAGTLAGGTKDLGAGYGDDPSLSLDLISNFTAIQRTYKNLQSVNWGTVAQSTLAQIGINVTRNVINGALNGFLFPTSSSVNTGGATGIVASGLTNLAGYTGGYYNAAAGGSATNSYYSSGYPTGYAVSGTNLVDRWTGAVVGKINAGVNTYLAGQPNTNTVKLGADGQPVTGTIMSSVRDPSTGEIASQFEVGTTASGGYISSNGNLNLVESVRITSADGSTVTYGTYRNGDVLVTNETTGTSQLYPNTTPTYGSTPTRSLSSYSTYGPTYAINPFSGQLTMLNGIANNVLSRPLNAVINGVLTPINTAIDKVFTTATNSLITNIIDPVTGKLTQGIDTLTGQITNLVGFGDPSKNPYLVCEFDSTTGLISGVDYGLSYAKDAWGDTVSVYSDINLNSWVPSDTAIGTNYYDP